MNWLAQNWVWILLAVGVVWFLSRGGLAGCGMGGHGSHPDHGSGAGREPGATPTGDGQMRNLGAAGTARPVSNTPENTTTPQRHRHRGC